MKQINPKTISKIFNWKWKEKRNIVYSLICHKYKIQNLKNVYNTYFQGQQINKFDNTIAIL